MNVEVFTVAVQSIAQKDIADVIQSNDYHRMRVTEKQLNFARQISQRTGQVLPWEVQQDRYKLSRWHCQKKLA